MRTPVFALTTAFLVFSFAAPLAAAADEVPDHVTQAMQDSARGDDSQDDERRQMAATLAFTGVKPGDTVVDMVPGSGYWTRVFSHIVGDNGQVYTVWPKEMLREYGVKGLAGWAENSVAPHYDNVTDIVQPGGTLALPGPADVVFTALNYHDYHVKEINIDLTSFNKSVFDQLKPGGVYVIVDHAAEEGSGLDATNSLHRIDPAVVKAEVEAAGFTFDGESSVLRNNDDPRTIKVFDDAIRGHTDQFIYRFRKP